MPPYNISLFLSKAKLKVGLQKRQLINSYLKGILFSESSNTQVIRKTRVRIFEVLQYVNFSSK